MSEQLARIIILGPPKSRKTSLYFTIADALHKKGFTVQGTEVTGGEMPDAVPRDVEKMFGEGRVIKLDVVQSNRGVQVSDLPINEAIHFVGETGRLDDGQQEVRGLSFLTDYYEQSYKLARYPGKGEKIGLVYTVLGLVGEAGELNDKIDVVFSRGQPRAPFPMVAAPVDVLNGIGFDEYIQIVLEAGDVLWYIAAAMHELQRPVQDFVDLFMEGSHRSEAPLLAFTSKLSELAKKHLRDDKPSEQVYEGVVAVARCLNSTIGFLGTTSELVAKMNLEKLTGRRERGSLKGDGDNR